MSLKNLAVSFPAAILFGLLAFPSALAATDGVQSEGVTITSQDLQQLFSALHQALQPNDMTVPIVVSIKKASDMPSYDQQYHYAGIDVDSKGAKVFHVWLNGDLGAKDEQDATFAAFCLAITDGGFAGTNFKSLYDIYAKEDSQLPAGAPDPFLNRHRFAAALVNQINSKTP